MKKGKNLDPEIWTENGVLRNTKVADEEGFWGSSLLLKTAEYTLYVFGTFWIVFYTVLKVLYNWDIIPESLVSAGISGLITRGIFKLILNRGDGKMFHEDDNSENITVYFASWLSNIRWVGINNGFFERGARYLWFYTALSSFRIPGTKEEESFKRNKNFTIQTTSSADEKDDINSPLDIDLGISGQQANDPLFIHGKVIARPNWQDRLGVYYATIRDNKDYEFVIRMTLRAFMNLAVDQIGAKYTKDMILGDKANEYYEECEERFMAIFEVAVEVDPIIGGLRIFSPVIFSGAKESSLTTKARSEAARGEILSAKADEMAAKTVKASKGTITFADALKAAQVTLGIVKKDVKENIISFDSSAQKVADIVGNVISKFVA